MISVKTKILKAWVLVAVSLMLLGACTTVPASGKFLSTEPEIAKTTTSQSALHNLPPPTSKVTVAVYGFEDKTGQFKPTNAGQTLSRAVSQGGDELLIKALHDWFTVIERANLNNLLKERQIISEMRSRYLGETKVNAQALPPLLFAGVIFEGGIVGFDSNTTTGGAAARYLGIGGKTDYRQNIVTVQLRAVSVKTGEVLLSVITEKKVSSVGVSANAFRFVTFDNLLEADFGITSNEPGVLALRQAVEKSVYSLIMEGAEIGLWNFADEAQGVQLIYDYQNERGNYRLSSDAGPSSANAAALQMGADRRKLAEKAKPAQNSKAQTQSQNGPVKPKKVAVKEPLQTQTKKTSVARQRMEKVAKELDKQNSYP